MKRFGFTVDWDEIIIHREKSHEFETYRPQ